MKSQLLSAVLVIMTASASAQAVENSAFKIEQSAGEWRAVNYIGQPIVNSTGEKIGDVNDVLFDRTGKITTVVIGVGGFLGLGEKHVALPFETITYGEKDGVRQITVPLTKEILQAAPDYKLTEQTTLDKVRKKAGEVATQATEKAVELKDQAVKQIGEMNKEEPKADGAAPR